MSQILFWLVISIGALIIDIYTSSFFFAGFTIGGIGAILAYIMGYGIIGQIILFIIISAFAVVFEYVWLRKRLIKNIPHTLTMEEKCIGDIIVAEEDISKTGRMKIRGIYWAIENAGEKILKGDKVKIIGINGNKFIIKKIGG